MVIGNKKCLQEYLYDFDVDSGGNGANIVLSSKDNASVLPVGAIVTGVTAHVLTAVTSDGAATLEWGNADTDGYSGTAIGKATLVENYVMDHATVGGALLWDDANDKMIPYRIADAAGGVFNLLINVADLTAGKIRFFVEYIMPSEI